MPLTLLNHLGTGVIKTDNKSLEVSTEEQRSMVPRQKLQQTLVWVSQDETVPRFASLRTLIRTAHVAAGVKRLHQQPQSTGTILPNRR